MHLEQSEKNSKKDIHNSKMAVNQTGFDENDQK